jgi:hypothetical protein
LGVMVFRWASGLPPLGAQCIVMALPFLFYLFCHIYATINLLIR